MLVKRRQPEPGAFVRIDFYFARYRKTTLDPRLERQPLALKKRALAGPCVEVCFAGLPADDGQFIEVGVIGVVLVAIELNIQ
jgi:hypothetical protein